MPDHKIIVHRGPKTGPVLATGLLCPDKEGVTEVHFESDTGVITLEHVKHAPLHIHGKTEFSYRGKKYHWKGHTGLVDDEHGTLLAIFYSSWFDLNWNKVGRLEVTTDGQKMLDIAVITALIVQERSDEEKQMVQLLCYLLTIPARTCEQERGRSIIYLELDSNRSSLFSAILNRF